ncbi:MAG: hypothetical protein ACKN82_02005 [Pirellula sp.]
MIHSKSTDLSIGWYGPVDGRWMSLLNHFQSVEILDRQSAAQWIDATSTDRKLLIGLEHRSDPKLAWVLDFVSKTNKKQTAATKRTAVSKKAKHRSMACILGEDWAGHRRTFPLPESIETYYWYQWYDQVLAWVGWESASEQTLSSGLRVGRIETDADRFLRWQKSKQAHAMLSNKIAWVVSDQDSSVELLQESLESYGIRAIGSRADQVPGEFVADLVIIETSSRNGSEFTCGESHDAQKEFLTQIRRRQPGAFMVVTDGFVQMGRWESYRQLGVDAVVGRPWSLQGLLFSWERWLTPR